MHEIVESVKRVTDIMGEITAASAEQTSGIEQINQAIVQMDQVTQQNAALVEEAAAASEALQEQAGQLAQVVAVFRLDGTAALRTVRPKQTPALTGKTAPAVRSAVAPQRAKQVTKLAAGDNGEWEQF